MSKIAKTLKEQLYAEQDERLAKVLAKKPSLREMIDELSRASVQKRLLIKARKTPITSFDYNKMTTICRLAYDGVRDNTFELDDAYTDIDDFNNLENLTRLFSPMGNAIIGHKTIKDYCDDYISNDEKVKLRNDYDDIKVKVKNIFESMEDESGIWVDTVKGVGLEHGVFERDGKKPHVLYNIEQIGIRYPELAAIAKEISLFKKENPDKAVMNFKGVKTAAFKKFLKEHE